MSKYTPIHWRWTCAGRQSMSIMAVSDAAHRRVNRKVNVTRAGNYGNVPPSPSSCWNSCNRLVALVGWALKGWLLRTSQHHSCSSYINISADWRASTAFTLPSNVHSKQYHDYTRNDFCSIPNIAWKWMVLLTGNRTNVMRLYTMCMRGEDAPFFFLFRHQGSICFFTLSYYSADRALGTWQRR